MANFIILICCDFKLSEYYNTATVELALKTSTKPQQEVRQRITTKRRNISGFDFPTCSRKDELCQQWTGQQPRSFSNNMVLIAEIIFESYKVEWILMKKEAWVYNWNEKSKNIVCIWLMEYVKGKFWDYCTNYSLNKWKGWTNEVKWQTIVATCEAYLWRWLLKKQFPVGKSL